MERELKRVDTIARVRRAFHVQGWSVKKIVRELHVSRNTVRRILRSDETDFAYERERQPLPRIGVWKAEIERFLTAEDDHHPHLTYPLQTPASAGQAKR